MPTRDDGVVIAVDDETIAGTLVSPRRRVPAVLFVHGWGGSQEHYIARAREVAALGCICLTFDLRGHVQTQAQKDTVSREENLRDVLAAYDVLAKQRGVDPERIAVVGSSYGGYLGAILTAKRKVRWLALRVPALYKDSGWTVPKSRLKKTQDLEAYRRKPVQASQSRALRACATFAGDVLIVESEHDVTVPHQVIVNYREACKQARSLTYRVIEDADHGLSEPLWQQTYTSILVSWLSEMLLGMRPSIEAAHPVAPSAAPPTAAVAVGTATTETT
ncbi:MAG: alpha/beta fold hydrolase [Casimicrobiaceae bacterium]